VIPQGAAELAVIAQRRAVLDELDTLLGDPATTETMIQMWDSVGAGEVLTKRFRFRDGAATAAWVAEVMERVLAARVGVLRSPPDQWSPRHRMG